MTFLNQVLVSLSARPLAFQWGSLPKDSLVVDVGGGFGIATLKLLKAFPHLKFIVQDLPSVVHKTTEVSYLQGSFNTTNDAWF